MNLNIWEALASNPALAARNPELMKKPSKTGQEASQQAEGMKSSKATQTPAKTNPGPATTSFMIQLNLQGVPPSKKNSHIIIVNKKTGRPMVIPKGEYRKWEVQAANLLRSQWEGKNQVVKGPLLVDLCFFVKGKRAWDLSNKAESVMDALVKAGVLEDDNRFCVKRLVLTWFESEDSDFVRIGISPFHIPR